MRARLAKTSKISAVLSITLNFPLNDSSRLYCCEGVSSSSQIIVSILFFSAVSYISLILPLPIYVWVGFFNFCTVCPTTSAPALLASCLSSDMDSCAVQRPRCA